MKTYHIEAKSLLGKIDFDASGLPKKLGIVTTIQYLHEMKKIVDYLWKKEIKAVVCGQVLGCDAGAGVRHKGDVDAFLYIGTGEFHPIGVALQTGKPVFVLHPESMNIRKLSSDDVEKIKKKKKGML
ncbi:diphthamide synthesis protein, partial [Candidatus Woesearchaeota archaeon]|nr:diphthamide synthesis protein [Candidatus Woesearchaeota archaeon]